MSDSRNATAPAVTAAGDGVSVGRRFTEPGVSPFDAVEWDIRDAVIGDPEKPAFEQRGVEFPKSWSQNSTNIVAQKYFRGRMDSPERESSVKQMIGRVAGTIATWGRDGGYFATDDDAQSFEDELTHILLHQMAAFNSPVWFNVGFEEQPQCWACQPYHAMVSTPEGMVPIGELVEGEQIGREVYDANGDDANRGGQGERPQAASVASSCATAVRRGDAGPRGEGRRRAADRAAVAPRRPAPAGHADASPSAPREGRRAALVAGGVAGARLTTSPDRRSEERDTRSRGRGGARRLAPGRRLRRAVRDRHEPVADDRVPGRERRRVRLGHGEPRHRVPGCAPPRARGRKPGRVADVRAIRLYGEVLREFVERWELLARGTRHPRARAAVDGVTRRDQRVPPQHLPGRRLRHRPP